MLPRPLSTSSIPRGAISLSPFSAVVIILVVICVVSICFLIYDYLARRMMDLLAVRTQQTAHMVSIITQKLSPLALISACAADDVPNKVDSIYVPRE